MRILVTGASGFIGRHVLEGLKDEEVLALSRRRDSRNHVAVDLGRPEEVRAVLKDWQPEGILHLAWYAVPGRYWTAAENLDCVGWTLGLARQAAELGCRRFVGVGTVAEYAWAPLLKESSPLQPSTLYGISKKACFEMLDTFFQSGPCSFAWARLGWTFGPGEPSGRLVPDLLDGLRAGRRVPCSEGLQRRDYLYVEDLASALVAVLRSEVRGAINVGSGEGTRVRDLIGWVEEAVGGQAEKGARPSEVPAEVVLSVERLRREVGWNPQWSLKEGVLRTVEAPRREGR